MSVEERAAVSLVLVVGKNAEIGCYLIVSEIGVSYRAGCGCKGKENILLDDAGDR